MQGETVRLGKLYNVPLVFTILIDDSCEKSGTIETRFGTYNIYTLGLYLNNFKTIKVWLKDYKGSYWSINRLKNIWYHEFLHFLDDCYGVPAPTGDHNKIFDERLKKMGLFLPSPEGDL